MKSRKMTEQDHIEAVELDRILESVHVEPEFMDRRIADYIKANPKLEMLKRSALERFVKIEVMRNSNPNS